MPTDGEGFILKLLKVTFEKNLDLGQTELQSIYWFLSPFVPLPMITYTSILNSI